MFHLSFFLVSHVGSKDKTHSSHPGNRIFRERIESMKEVYRGTKNKQGKMEITKDIVRYLQETYSTRFLKRDGNGLWVEVTIQAARDKVSHALRFAARKDAKQKQQQQQQQRGILGAAQPQPVKVNTSTATAVNNALPTTTEKKYKVTSLGYDSQAAAAPPQQPATIHTTSTSTSAPPPVVPAAQPQADSSAFCGAIPEEHIEHSKWLLALRQG